MFNKILIVCIGNICRSPSAERILQQLMPNKNINSAGIGALIDHPIEQHAAELLIKGGFNVQNHKAQQISGDLISNAELVLVMEKKHQQVLMQKYPAASGKIMLLGKWHKNEEIPDPYQKSMTAFEHAFNLIKSNCETWANKLNR